MLLPPAVGWPATLTAGPRQETHACANSTKFCLIPLATPWPPPPPAPVCPVGASALGARDPKAKAPFAQAACPPSGHAARKELPACAPEQRPPAAASAGASRGFPCFPGSWARGGGSRGGRRQARRGVPGAWGGHGLRQGLLPARRRGVLFELLRGGLLLQQQLLLKQLLRGLPRLGALGLEGAPGCLRRRLLLGGGTRGAPARWRGQGVAEFAAREARQLRLREQQLR